MDNVKIELDKKSGWELYESIHVKGFAYDDNGNLLTKQELAKHITRAENPRDLIHFARGLNGLFSAVGRLNFGAFAIVDRARSIPLFYSTDDNVISFADNPYVFSKTSVDELALFEFKTAGYSLGGKTLFKEVSQVEAGFVAYTDSKNVLTQEYEVFKPKGQLAISFDDAKEELRNILDRCMMRMVNSINSKHISIPLSGGYDSRFVVAWLAKNSIDNFTTFTYGKSDNPEIPLAKKVADVVGCKWIPIPYTDEIISGLHRGKTLDSYTNYASLACSMPFFQDYPAMVELYGKNLIPHDSVFVPGHPGDMVGGSSLMPNYKNISPDSAIEVLVNGHHPYHEIKKKHRQNLFNSIEKTVVKYSEHPMFQVLEHINRKERQAKFILNSCRTYQYFGHALRLPLFDNELVDFFKTLPFDFKIYKRLYKETLEDFYLKPMNLVFEKELQPTTKQYFEKQLKNYLKTLVPGVEKLSRTQPDNICYTDIANRLFETYSYQKNKGFRKKYLNAPIIDWYLNFFHEKFNIPVL